MNKPIINEGWSKRRFNWKEEIQSSRDLSRGAKLLATHLCDKYAGRNNGQCWPSNRKLAEAQACTVRTIQRHISELIEAGWVKVIPSSRHKRLLRLGFPDAKSTCHHDKTHSVTMTERADEDDTIVVPYKKEPNKKPNRVVINKSLRVVRIDFSETNKITSWMGWASIHLDLPWERLEPLLRKRGQLNLPCAYPEDAELERQAYQLFFQRAIESKGDCFA